MVDLDLFYGLGFAMLMAGLVNASRAKAVVGEPGLVSRGMARVAVWSYAIFLLHAPVITFVCKVLVALGLPDPVGWPLAMVLSLWLSVVAGALAQRLVEAPVDRMIVQGWRALTAQRRSRLIR